MRSARAIAELASPTARALATAGVAIAAAVTSSCAPHAAHPSPSSSSSEDSDRRGPPRAVVVPLPGWPRWLGEVNHQISGLAFRDGHLYAIPDQSGAETRALFEVTPIPPRDDVRVIEVRARCRWQGGPHPDAEGMALDPLHGPPRAVLLALESRADALLTIGFDDCARIADVMPLTGSDSNVGIEGIALSPDGETVYLVHESKSTLLAMPRAGPGPAREITRIEEAHSLCDAAYDDRGTEATDDDRLLLLDRNARRIFDVTLSGRVVGIWDLDRDALGRDPDGNHYSLVSLEALALEAREPDGSLFVFAATDSPPPPLPYSRRGKDDDAGRYARRVGMLYRFRLPPLE